MTSFVDIRIVHESDEGDCIVYTRMDDQDHRQHTIPITQVYIHGIYDPQRQPQPQPQPPPLSFATAFDNLVNCGWALSISMMSKKATGGYLVAAADFGHIRYLGNEVEFKTVSSPMFRVDSCASFCIRDIRRRLQEKWKDSSSVERSYFDFSPSELSAVRMLLSPAKKQHQKNKKNKKKRLRGDHNDAEWHELKLELDKHNDGDGPWVAVKPLAGESLGEFSQRHGAGVRSLIYLNPALHDCRRDAIIGELSHVCLPVAVEEDFVTEV